MAPGLPIAVNVAGAASLALVGVRVRLALKERVLAREEDRHLLRLAHHLGTPAPRAMDIQDEAERAREVA